MNSVIFQGIQFRIAINFSTYDLESPSTPLNGSSRSVISSTTTPFSLLNIDQHYSSVKNSNQFNYSKTFLYSSIDFGGTKLMSTFDNKSLKKVTLKSTITHQCYTFKTIK